MTGTDLIEKLRERELISQITDEILLKKILLKQSINIYCGFDPTADSLHLGHLVPLVLLKYFQDAGHKPIILIGGATGLIGDPSFKSQERKLCDKKIIDYRVKQIDKQISFFLDVNCGPKSALILNNDEWFAKMNILAFLRDIGKHFSINQMINKDAIKQRLNREEQGISFTEFSYNLLQSYDFTYLNKFYNVTLQIGGSDQWGNIVSGIMLTRRVNHKQVFGLTCPIITKSNGTKFGKTENESIWLDPKKTSPYKFYQFWINTSDNDVYRFLKIFTFLTLNQIQKLINEDNKPNSAQYILAENVTRLVHGESGLVAAQRITKSLFSGIIDNLTKLDLEQLAQDGLNVVKLCQNNDLQQVLVYANLAPSRSQAAHLINSGAILINGKRQLMVKYYFCNADKLFSKFTVICRGKKYYALLIWE